MHRNTRHLSGHLVLLLLACLFLLPGSASAQTQSTGSIAGRLTDTSGAAIANAEITLISRATGTQTKSATDATGEYRFNLDRKSVV